MPKHKKVKAWAVVDEHGFQAAFPTRDDARRYIKDKFFYMDKPKVERVELRILPNPGNNRSAWVVGQFEIRAG